MFKEDQKIGQYTLIRKLAKGGFGEVWLAEKQSPLVTKKVAVKLPHDSQVDIETVKQEAMLWEQASGHPNVLPIIDADIYDGQVIIVSEFAEDGSLSDKLRANGGKLPVEEAVRITIGILNGLDYLHSKNIIHRDIKPANILMQGDTPRLTDFGISRAIQTEHISSAVVGTYNYMSPESFEGVRNVKTDVWSVGVVLYQLLNGLPPYPQKEPSEVMYAILLKDYKPLSEDIPERLREIVYKALEKDQLLGDKPPRRYQTAAEMRDDLNDFLRTWSKPFITQSTRLVSPLPEIASNDPKTKIQIPAEAFLQKKSTYLWQPFFKGKLSPAALLAVFVAALGIIGITLYLYNNLSPENAAQAENPFSVNSAANNGVNYEINKDAAVNLEEAIIFSKQGETYYKKKQFDSAIAAYTKSIDLNPNDFGVYNNRGIAYHVKRELENAIADYTRAIELNPTHFSGYNNRGAAYEDMKKYELAAADFRRATELDPKNKTAQDNLKRVLKKLN